MNAAESKLKSIFPLIMRFLLLSVMCIKESTYSFAQNSIGIVGGVNASAYFANYNGTNVIPKLGGSIYAETCFGSKPKGEWQIEFGYRLNRLNKKVDTDYERDGIGWKEDRVISLHGGNVGLNRLFKLSDNDKARWNLLLGISTGKVLLSNVKRDGRLFDSTSNYWDEYSSNYTNDDARVFYYGAQLGIEYVVKLKDGRGLVLRNSYHFLESRSSYFISGDNFLFVGELKVGYRFYREK